MLKAVFRPGPALLRPQLAMAASGSGDNPKPLPLPQLLWQIPNQPAQLRFGVFGFQLSAAEGWPTGGLEFRLRHRLSARLKPRPRSR